MTRGGRNIKWIEKYLRVPEGDDVGKPLRLRRWQRQIIRSIYDNPHGTRRAIFSFGRKNAKTTLAACILLLHLVGPEVYFNSQLYSSAQSRKQAALIFKAATKMIRQSPTLNDLTKIKPSTKEIECPKFGTSYEALSADVPTSLGLSPRFVIHDELGQVKGPLSDLYEALETAQGAYKNPLSIVISTQATKDEDLLSILIDDAKANHDPRVVLTLYTSNPDPEIDNPFTLRTIKKSNPALGDFLAKETVLESAASAKRMPSRFNSYRNYVLNQRVDTEFEAWLTDGLWKPLLADLDIEDYVGMRCMGGLDLSISNDLTALVLVFPMENGDLHVFSYFWMPGGALEDLERRDKKPYQQWVERGHLFAPPGKVIDYQHAAAFLTSICSRFKLEGIAYDPYKIELLQNELDKLTMSPDISFISHGQGFYKAKKTKLWMPGSIEATESFIKERKIKVARNPVLSWCVSNTKCQESSVNPADRKFVKKGLNNVRRIDGSVALVQAIGAASMDLDMGLHEHYKDENIKRWLSSNPPS